MYKECLLNLLVFAVLYERVTAIPAAAGKCRPCNLTNVPQITLEGLEALKPWRLIYASGAPMYGSADNEIRDGYRIAGNKFNITYESTMLDKSHNKYEFKASMVDNVCIEEYVDENGKGHRFYDYPMAASECGLLYYRCSDAGRSDIDTRYIEIPDNCTISEDGIQYLLKVDSSCKFHGNLRKLPEKLLKGNS